MTLTQAVSTLKSLLEPSVGGSCEVRLRYRRQDAEVLLRLGADWRVKPTDGFLRQAHRLLGADGLTIRFGPPLAESADRQLDYASG